MSLDLPPGCLPDTETTEGLTADKTLSERAPPSSILKMQSGKALEKTLSTNRTESTRTVDKTPSALATASNLTAPSARKNLRVPSNTGKQYGQAESSDVVGKLRSDGMDKTKSSASNKSDKLRVNSSPSKRASASFSPRSGSTVNFSRRSQLMGSNSEYATMSGKASFMRPEKSEIEERLTKRFGGTTKLNTAISKMSERMSVGGHLTLDAFGRSSVHVKAALKSISEQASMFKLTLWLCLEEPFATFITSIFSCMFLVIVVMAVGVAMIDTNPQDLRSVWAGEKKWEDIFDVTCNIIFSVEVCLRIWSSPSRLSFLTNSMNILDVCAVIPFWLNDVCELHKSLWMGFETLSTFEAFARLVKTCRYFWGWKLLFHALRESVVALIIPFFFLLVTATFGSCVFMVLDGHFDTDVSSGGSMGLTDAIHYAVVCVVSISIEKIYRFHPATPGAQVTAILLMICGVTFMAMPLTIVGTCFSQTWFAQDRILLLDRIRTRLKKLGHSLETLPEVFDDIDANCSGDIEFDEFVAMIDSFHLKINIAKARELFNFFDFDMDGVISYQDFACAIYPDENIIDDEGSEGNFDTEVLRYTYESEASDGRDDDIVAGSSQTRIVVGDIDSAGVDWDEIGSQVASNRHSLVSDIGQASVSKQMSNQAMHSQTGGASQGNAAQHHGSVVSVQSFQHHGSMASAQSLQHHGSVASALGSGHSALTSAQSIGVKQAEESLEKDAFTASASTGAFPVGKQYSSGAAAKARPRRSTLQPDDLRGAIMKMGFNPNRKSVDGGEASSDMTMDQMRSMNSRQSRNSRNSRNSFQSIASRLSVGSNRSAKSNSSAHVARIRKTVEAKKTEKTLIDPVEGDPDLPTLLKRSRQAEAACERLLQVLLRTQQTQKTKPQEPGFGFGIFGGGAGNNVNAFSRGGAGNLAPGRQRPGARSNGPSPHASAALKDRKSKAKKRLSQEEADDLGVPTTKSGGFLSFGTGSRSTTSAGGFRRRSMDDKDSPRVEEQRNKRDSFGEQSSMPAPARPMSMWG